MVSVKNFLSYLDHTITFTVHTDASDKQLGAVVSQNNKTIESFSRRLIKPQHNYTTITKELLMIVKRLKQYIGIIFGY